ncbi:hypothetical protein GCM10027443_25880 [Pontibacter brevis]
MKKLILMCLLVPEPLFAETNLEATHAMVSLNAKQDQSETSGVITADEELSRYAGTYQLNEQFQIKVSAEAGKLFGLAPGDAEKTEFTHVSKNKFIIKGSETTVEFLEEDGAVQYMFVNMQGGLKLKNVR